MPLSQRQNEPKPRVFLSFAGEDVEWKRSLMKPAWWSALTRVADVYDYEDRPWFGDSKMSALVEQSSAFIPILSKYYIKKAGVIEDEFMTAVRKFGEVRDREKLFCPIVIDLDSKTWWDEGNHPAFVQNAWLRETIYLELIEGKGPALLTGDLEPLYARQVRTFAQKIAECIGPVGARQLDAECIGPVGARQLDNELGPQKLWTFVSFSQNDRGAAMEIVRELERAKIGCWISTRDVPYGKDYQEAIVDAIDQADSMVLVFSNYANDSAEVHRELALASERKILILPLRIEDAKPAKGLRYQLATRQYVNLYEDREQKMKSIIETLEKIRRRN